LNSYICSTQRAIRTSIIIIIIIIIITPEFYDVFPRLTPSHFLYKSSGDAVTCPNVMTMMVLSIVFMTEDAVYAQKKPKNFKILRQNLQLPKD
jgi:hypothetical protein